MEQLRVIHTLFVDHDRIKRTVTNLPNGIRTVTESDDPQIAALLKTHVADMMKRVGAGDDPGLPIESDALHSIFRDKDKIRTSVETTASGAVVVQTSDDPKVVAELQEHAAQVTDFAQEGMAAIHTAMMRKFGGRMPGGMMAPGDGRDAPARRALGRRRFGLLRPAALDAAIAPLPRDRGGSSSSWPLLRALL